MYAEADDLEFAFSGRNCYDFQLALNNSFDSINGNLTEKYEALFSNLSSYFGEDVDEVGSAVEMCEYLNWAYYHNVELIFNYSLYDIDACNSLNKDLYFSQYNVSEQLDGLATVSFLTLLKE